MAVETLRNPEQDLPQREELRFILPIESTPAVLEALEINFHEVEFSDRHINRTIYFNNQEHEVPWGLSLRARQYFHARTLHDSSNLNGEEAYIVEIKEAPSINKRIKTRYELPLKDAARMLTEKTGLLELSSPLRPYIAVEYERRHFKSRKEGAKSRVTCDFSPDYYLIGENSELTFLATEPSIRVEIKDSGDDASEYLLNLASDLRKSGAMQTVSKKSAGYNYEAGTYKATDGKPTKELKDVEIESKLVVTDSNPYVFFNKLLSFFKAGVGDFTVPVQFTHVTESGSVNSYFASADGREAIKVLARPTSAKVVLKSDSQLVEDKHGLNCILRRSETKGQTFPLSAQGLFEIIRSNGGADLIGEIERLRKAFWVRNLSTQRVYHISIDRSQAEGQRFYELEVEYTGSKGRISNDPEPEIVEDIADITKIIVDKFPQSVKKDPIEKIQWLKQVIAMSETAELNRVPLGPEPSVLPMN